MGAQGGPDFRRELAAEFLFGRSQFLQIQTAELGANLRASSDNVVFHSQGRSQQGLAEVDRLKEPTRHPPRNWSEPERGGEEYN